MPEPQRHCFPHFNINLTDEPGEFLIKFVIQSLKKKQIEKKLKMKYVKDSAQGSSQFISGWLGKYLLKNNKLHWEFRNPYTDAKQKCDREGGPLVR